MWYVSLKISEPTFRFTVMILLLMVYPGHGFAHDQDILPLRLDPRPFSPALCQTSGHDKTIRIQVAKYQDLVIRQVPGQLIPSESDKARIKHYVHFLTLHDLTDGIVTQGAIAFDRDHAVIFTPEHPMGLARSRFLASLPEPQQKLGNAGLNTFLRLRPVLQAAIDTCRPYPPFVIYGTDEEIDRIEAARKLFTQRVHQFNAKATALPALAFHETGITDGFVDPEAGRGTNVSYQALNPLNFYVRSQ
ncbi:MAG: hypothetical protein KC592_03035 [Nitrospira sp.]|nr:hypothetical protein [Nitrospira sp.]HNP29191.1 hypothetical protein [Nitrospirales bacterium]